MAYIKVDHSKFATAASEVESYVETMRSNMNSANREVNTLAQSWQGADYTQFKTQWDKVDNENSTHTQMLKSLESYGRFLRYASSQYKEAQNRAVNRANGLPRY